MVLCLMVFVAALAFACKNGYAGCHYGDGRSFNASKENHNPREHARNFKFMGQWIYEGGEIKYVPLQGALPCHGPNCHADENVPETGVVPPTTVKRIPPVTFAITQQLSAHADLVACHLGSNTLRPLSGYPHEHEYPP